MQVLRALPVSKMAMAGTSPANAPVYRFVQRSSGTHRRLYNLVRIADRFAALDLVDVVHELESYVPPSPTVG